MVFSARSISLIYSAVCVFFHAANSKECYGVGHPDGPMALAETVDANNSKYFEGCKIVRGNIFVRAYAIDGDDYNDVPPMTAQLLAKTFSSIEVITGYLSILGWHKNLSDFSAFGNLTTIRGDQLFRGIAAIVIQDTTGGSPYNLESIKSLGFRSLKSIERGNLYIGYMRNLCYADTVNWTRVLKNPIEVKNFVSGVMLRNNKKCNDESCHAACDDGGCWGPGDQDCLSCKYFTLGKKCVLECGEGFYHSGTECLPCDDQCDTCYASGPGSCLRCKKLRLPNGKCGVPCPDEMCIDVATDECRPCFELLKKVYKQGKLHRK